ncbi:MAG: N-acetylmuramoyl-L-alanine amidase [Clostridia bacterium]
MSKKCIISISIACVFCVILLGCGGVSLATAGHNRATIIVDAGHGGSDGGVVGSQGQKESDINLAIAYILQNELANCNFDVVMTRVDKNALGATKKKDMQARKQKIVETRPNLVISIHANKFSNKDRRGAQVFYDDSKIGKYFADNMQARLNQNVNARFCGRTNLQALGGDFFITKCAPCPSIIVECGFLSNLEDEKLLMSVEYRQLLAKEICAVAQNAFE